ncbi:MAG: HDOD domain-containing protein [Chitinivorax sp.]
MFKRLLQLLFGKSPARPDGSAAIAPAMPHAPLEGLTVEGEKAVIRREPVLDRQQQTIGYELSLRYGMARQSRGDSSATRHLRDLMLLSHLQVLDLGKLLGKRLALFHLDARQLNEPALAQLPLCQCVLLLELSDGIKPDALASLLAAYRKLGLRFGLSIRQHAHPLAAVVQPYIDYLLLEPDDPLTWTSDVADWIHRQSQLQLLARRIDSEEAFLSAHRSLLYGGKVELFQGNFISSREHWPEHPVEPGRLQIIELMNQLHQDADNDTLAQALKQDSVLLYRILRLVNSPGLRTGHSIASAEEALMVLGREQLFRWLTVLLFQVDGESARDLSLLDQALIRARFMETIGGAARSPAEANQRFLVGLFSLLDVLLQCPLQRALGLLQLPPTVGQALLENNGPHAAYLQLALLCERDELDELAATAEGGSAARLDDLLRQTGLQPLAVDTCHLAALHWAESLRP